MRCDAPRVLEVLREVVFRVMAGRAALAYEVGELTPGDSGEFSGLAEGQDRLRVERDGEFGAETRLMFGRG